jgi:hypothetical protein
MKIGLRRIFPFSILAIVSSCLVLISCGNKQEAGTEYSAEDATEENVFNSDENKIENGQTNFENYESVSITIDQEQNFDWDTFKQQYQYQNPEESEGNRIVGSWIDWGEYQYRLDVINGGSRLELLTIIRQSDSDLAQETLLTMNVADQLQLSALWVQMETLAINLESNLDSSTILLKSDVN